MNQKSFTMIELLLVITMIGVLAGVLVQVIDPDHSRKTAEDGVRAANLSKVAQGVEAYFAAEGTYPTDAGNNGNPIDNATDPLRTYLTEWPTTNVSTEVFYYYTDTNSGVSYMCISVPMATVANTHFKYVSPYGTLVSGNRSCSGKVLKSCPDAAKCSAGDRWELDNCVQQNDVVCT